MIGELNLGAGQVLETGRREFAYVNLIAENESGPTEIFQPGARKARLPMHTRIFPMIDASPIPNIGCRVS